MVSYRSFFQIKLIIYNICKFSFIEQTAQNTAKNGANWIFENSNPTPRKKLQTRDQNSLGTLNNMLDRKSIPDYVDLTSTNKENKFTLVNSSNKNQSNMPNFGDLSMVQEPYSHQFKENFNPQKSENLHNLTYRGKNGFSTLNKKLLS